MPDSGGALRLGQVYPPAGDRRRVWVARPRLLRMLAGPEADVLAPIVLVSAPAGAGKSVLARQWLEVDGREHLEVPLGPGLDEPSALARALVTVLETVGSDGRNLRASITSTEPGLSTILVPGLTRFTASRSRSYVLVVDDVHLLRNPGCHAVLRAVCDGTPAGSQVLLLTRQESPAWLALARAEGRLVEATSQDLRFDVDEAAALLAAMQVNSPVLDVNDLVVRTEGWAVGLYLTGLAMRRTTRGSLFAVPTESSRDSDRFIRDYISQEVLAPLDPELHSFALRTSVLDELEPALCDAVLLRRDSPALLTRLQEQIQLVIPLAPGGHRVRYHHLLAETLLTELSRHTPWEVSELHARASRWYADQGLLDEAIRHAKAAGDLSEVGRLVWTGSGKCLGSGEKDRVAFWLADLTETQITQDRWLCLAAAWVAIESGDPQQMDRWLLCAEDHAGRDWQAQAHSEAYAAQLAVVVALLGRDGLRRTEALCTAALGALPADSPYRVLALFILGVALTLTREGERGHQALVDAERSARALDVPIILADSLSWQGVLALAAGDLPKARQVIRQATHVILENRLERLATSAHCITAQALLLALAHDTEATTTLREARRLTALLGDVVPWFAVCGRLVQARAAVSMGEATLARQLLTESTARMSPDLQDSLARDIYEGVERALATMKVDGVAVPVLTSAELRVLQFLPSHLQMTQIGEHLFVSTNTVKTHVMAIYRKLGVRSRSQAVIRGHELGLLEARGVD
jgi:LuxR family transcriptional regulator, maltose regulon positive regulatory protein